MKKLFFFAIVLFLSLNLSACTHIEDTNGDDDYTIETFDDDDILKKSSSYSSLGMIEKTINNESSLTISKFTGIYNFLSFKVNNQDLSFSIESTVTSGNFRIVIVKDNYTISDIEINASDLIEIKNASGTYVVKVIGESAKFSLKLVKH